MSLCKRSDCNIDHDEQLDRLKAFVADLTKLSEQYGFWIGGCGDCGSPWVTDELVEPLRTTSNTAIDVLRGSPERGYTAETSKVSIEEAYRNNWSLHL